MVVTAVLVSSRLLTAQEGGDAPPKNYSVDLLTWDFDKANWSKTGQLGPFASHDEAVEAGEAWKKSVAETPAAKGGCVYEVRNAGQGSSLSESFNKLNDVRAEMDELATVTEEYADQIARAYEDVKQFRQRMLKLVPKLTKDALDNVNASIASWNSTYDRVSSMPGPGAARLKTLTRLEEIGSSNPASSSVTPPTQRRVWIAEYSTANPRVWEKIGEFTDEGAANDALYEWIVKQPIKDYRPSRIRQITKTSSTTTPKNNRRETDSDSKVTNTTPLAGRTPTGNQKGESGAREDNQTNVVGKWSRSYVGNEDIGGYGYFETLDIRANGAMYLEWGDTGPIHKPTKPTFGAKGTYKWRIDGAQIVFEQVRMDVGTYEKRFELNVRDLVERYKK